MLELDFYANKNKKYKIDVIQTNIVYISNAKSYLLGLYYLVVQKDYPKEENI